MKLIAVRRAAAAGCSGLVPAALAECGGLARGDRQFFCAGFLGIPFADPVGATQVAVMGFLPAGRLLAGALLSLVVALLGRVFCSWVCPYGVLSELVYAVRWRREWHAAGGAAPLGQNPSTGTRTGGGVGCGLSRIGHSFAAR